MSLPSRILLQVFTEALFLSLELVLDTCFGVVSVNFYLQFCSLTSKSVSPHPNSVLKLKVYIIVFSVTLVLSKTMCPSTQNHFYFLLFSRFIFRFKRHPTLSIESCRYCFCILFRFSFPWSNAFSTWGEIFCGVSHLNGSLVLYRPWQGKEGRHPGGREWNEQNHRREWGIESSHLVLSLEVKQS